MRMMANQLRVSWICALAWACVAMPCAWAAGNIDPTNKFAWTENVGWVNFAPTNGGVTVHYNGTSGYLTGFAWGENIGWIKLGADSGGPYANTSATDWGVNLDGEGNLSGLAWGENVGWIKFNPAHSAVTINMATGRFQGDVWGENIGWLRFQGNAPDYNVRTLAFDKQPQTITHYVSLSGSHTAPFTDWMTAATNIQAAIDVTMDGDTVLVTNGVYTSGGKVKSGYQLMNRVYITNAITLQSVHGPAFTIIDGQGSCRCVSIGNAAKLIGFTLTNGVARGTSEVWEQGGGGLFFDFASNAVASNCVITGNRAEIQGGGIYSSVSTVTLQNLLVMGNSAQSAAPSSGGGLRASYGSLLLINSVFQQNFSGSDGGGLLLYHTESTLRNLLFTGNSAPGKGGGMIFDGCSPILENITMVGNSSSSGRGGALNISYDSQPTLRNCILWSNTPNQIVFDTDWFGMALTVDHCDIQGGLAGIETYGLGLVTWLDGNLDTNPLFVAVGNYRLQSISPCINAGTKAWMVGATDLDGNPRLYAGGRVDMGAYEYQGMSAWPNTAAPIVADAGPDSAVELGVKFKSDAAGTIAGIRFYKAAANMGVHIGNLWSSTGTRLATATFANETTSGWQQVLFATPVTIASNTIYVASYHANNGHYSADGNYFSGKSVDNPPLHLLMNGVFGGNGVYAYGTSSVFPDQSYNAANYWVDVVFIAGSPRILTSIAVTPASSSILTGASQQFTAMGTYSDGSTRDITSQATWTSADTGVATINAGGLATGVSAGTTMISATLADVTGSTGLSVQPALPPIHYVSLSGAHISPFTSWYTAATNIQAAVNVAAEGDTVWVTNGVYNSGGAVTPGYSLTNRVVIAKPIRVQSVNGPDVTFIVGQGPSGAEAVRCAYLTNGAQLCGFTLTNGHTREVGDINDHCGGGVFLHRGTMVSNCVLTGNSVVGEPGRGGGAFTIELTEGGGGLLVDCVLEGNSAVRGGGAYGGELRNCVIRGNTAGYGGGVKNALLRNCLVVRNEAWGICGGAKGCDLVNCTVSGNSNGGAYEGGGMVNSVVYDNEGYNYTRINGPITYTCTIPWTDGEGNLAADPWFVNPAGSDYHLQCTSPCINAGTNQDWMIGATDLDGNPRLYAGGRVDMGAYEYQGMSAWPNTAAPIVADAGPDSAVELGVKFKSDAAGTIAGIRFYKAAANTGIHIGNLWASDGTRLAMATFMNETASGWQQVLFATPVTIASNTIYVASYHATNGHYSADANYFQGKGVDNPPLHLLMNGVFGGNGVYAYGTSSVFPDQSYNAANYWVDVVFIAGSPRILTSIAVTPASSSILTGASQQFTAMGTYSDGSTRDITSQATWTSADTGVATINAGGLATGVSAGATMISAMLAGVTGSAMLSVQPALPPIHYVSLSGAHVSPFTSWATAATNIQAAINVAVDGDMVLVTNGVYNSGGAVTPGYALITRVVVTNNVIVQSVNGPEVTTIVGQGPIGMSAVRCAYLTGGATLAGFTLTNGHTNVRSGGPSGENCGGGVFMLGVCVVSNCVITGNRTEYVGGGIYNQGVSGAAGLVVDCLIRGNWAGNGGGGARLSDAIGSTFRNCAIVDNLTDGDGGGMHFYHAGIMKNCLIARNTAGVNAGGVFIDWGSYYGSTNTVFDNCTITSNSAPMNGGFGYVIDGAQVRNSIIWNNANGNWAGGNYTFCCTTPLPSGSGNITNNPLFASATGNYRLTAGSSCIDAGTNQAWMIGVTDLDGNPRLDAGGRVDMGAYEFQGMSAWPNTAAPIVADAGPDSAVELGVKFKSDAAGTIAGIRFYKAAANTGIHIGNLWASDGTRLATATFMNETASGWQQAFFATPVTIASNTVYVASYHATNGHYSADANYFLVKGVDNPPLHLLMNGVFGGNGVYRYDTSSVFPDQSYNAANYWVDVVFIAGSPPILTSIAVTPASSSILIGASQQFTAMGTYSDGSTQDITSQAKWISSDTGVATINAGGLATGVSAGATMISAMLAGVIGSAVLTVQSPLSSIHYVSLSGAHVSPFTNWHTAATNIQAAIDAASDGDTVLVTNGVYATGGAFSAGLMNRVAITKAVTVQSVNGPRVTIIQGQEPMGIEAVRCAYVADGTALIGFTLTNGFTQTSYDNSGSGGGIYCDSAAGIVSNCALTGNRAYYYGGGAYHGTLYNCTLTGNSANSSGGGVYHGTLYNCTLTGNSAFDGGGAFDGTLYNCTLTGNLAYSRGGGAYYGTLYNCIVYYNSAVSGANYDGSAFNYSCTTPHPGGSGNITSEPQLASFSHLALGSPCRGTGHSDYAAGTDIDGEAWHTPPPMGCDEVVTGAITGALNVRAWVAFTNVAVGFSIQFKADILGRTARSVWDFGDGTVLSNKPYAIHAYTSPGVYAILLRAYNESYPQGMTATVTVHVAAQTIHYVKLGNATPLTPYASWTTAATNIQDALDVANQAGALVLVSNGIYATGGRVVYGALSNRVAITKPVTVRSVNGPTMTIIQGAGPMGDSAVRCAYLGNNAALEGFMLTDGATRSSGYYYEQFGGGVCCESSGVLSNCVLTGNSALYGGGASGGTLYNCTLTGNLARGGGGGAYYGTLYNCTLTGNLTHGNGGGAYYGTLYNCQLTENEGGWGSSGGGAYRGTLYNCTLIRNMSEIGGGVSRGTLYNCTLTGNEAQSGGGAYYGTLYNCTLTGNEAQSGGGAEGGTLYNCTLTGNRAFSLFGGGASDGTLHNCTLTGNSAIRGGGAWRGTLYNCIVYYNTASSYSNYQDCTLNYSCTTPHPGGVGNITNDPRFVNAAAGDYHLQSTSPCINAGTNQDWMIGATDIAGNPRLDAGGRVDMGAYEYQGISAWPNTAAPIVADAGPDSAVELGVKFKSDAAGTIAGIRFYKAAANTGVHIGNLWSSTGTRLATATFMNETTSGWQQALFATPVTITSNMVYVASYHANSGHYSADVNYFQGKGVDNPPLHALANGVSGGNGVYAYGASSLFPSQTWNAANYWVDVVFQPVLPPPPLSSMTLMAVDASTRETMASTAGGNVERWPTVWTSGDLSKECGASNLIDGDTNTLWIGNVGGDPWRVILDLGVVTDISGIQLMFQDTAWTNQEIIGSRDSEVWFDYLAETNEWVSLRYLYVNFRGDERGAQPPAIREIIWRDR